MGMMEENREWSITFWVYFKVMQGMYRLVYVKKYCLDKGSQSMGFGQG